MPAVSSPQHSRPQKLQKKNWTNQEGILRVRRSLTFRGKNLAVTKTFDLRAMSKKRLVCWRKVFSGVVNTPFYMSRERLWDKRFFFQKINQFDILFWFWMKKFQICGRSFRQRCQKQSPPNQRTFLVKRSLGEDTTLYLLMVFLTKFWFARKLQVRQ